MVPPNLLLTGQRAVIGGEALNATFGPANCPPTNSATSNAAASKLPPITAKKPMLDFWCAISGPARQLPKAFPDRLSWSVVADFSYGYLATGITTGGSVAVHAFPTLSRDENSSRLSIFESGATI
jgi:hypothetical protein